MTIVIKRGVDLSGLSPDIWKAVLITEPFFSKYNADLVITSGRDGAHKSNSLHYTGNALDFRSLHLTKLVKDDILLNMRKALGANYDVLLHGSVEHFHVEYDPK